jgi:hypothetical protein
MLIPMAAAAASAGGALTVAYQTSLASSGTSNGGTLTMPVLAEGDLILVAQAASKTSSITAAYGTGFTSITTAQIGTYNGAAEQYFYIRGCLSYKVAGSGDSEDAITGFMNATQEKGSIVVYRPSVPLTSVTIQDISTQATAANPSASTITASASTKITIAMAASASNATGSTSIGTPSMTFTPSEDVEVLTPRFKTLVQDPTASDVVGDAADGGFNTVYMDCYLELE